MKKIGGATYYTYLALGIIIGVIIVIASSFIIKWKYSANEKKLPESLPQVFTSPAITGSPQSSASLESTFEPTRVDMVRDPVCKNLINPHTALKYEFQNKMFYFCSEICERSFEAEPFRYVEGTMKVEINIQTLPQSTPETTETLESSPEKTEPISEPITTSPIPTIAAPPSSKPPRKTPHIGPTPEEIPLIEPKTTQKPTQKMTPKPTKPKTDDLQIEEIPLE